MRDDVKRQVAEILQRACDRADQSALWCNRAATGGDVLEAIRTEADLILDPPPPEVKPEWPKVQTWSKHWPAMDVECYPIGVVGPVVEALRRIDDCFCGPAFKDTPLANGKNALAAFDAAVRGE